jgi:hypothetical protein
MSKIDDKMFQRRKAFLQRKRVVEVGSAGQMTPERVKCPFCSELILPDAIKCRFCGEWFSDPDQDMDQASPFNVEPSHKEPYKLQNPITIATTQAHFESSQPDQPQESQASSQVNDEHMEEPPESVEKVDEPEPARIAREIIPIDKAIMRSDRQGFQIPWLRALLLILYLGIIAALTVTEFSARMALNEARRQDDPNNAIIKYRYVRNTYPHTFASIDARDNLNDLGDKEVYRLPEVLQKAWSRLLSNQPNERDLHVLPFAVWPISALMLFLVFVSRIRRIGVAFIAFLLMILAILGFIAQLVWYDLFPLEVLTLTDPITKVMQAPKILYISSYVLLALAAFMTLTATASRLNSVNLSKAKER